MAIKFVQTNKEKPAMSKEDEKNLKNPTTMKTEIKLEEANEAEAGASNKEETINRVF
jgi:hypothetical protein